MIEIKPDTPAAWLGYGPRIGQVRVCQRCPDRPQAEALAKKHGFKPHYDICPACYIGENRRRFGD